jgi:mono/diheme cytochrome c family protein
LKVTFNFSLPFVAAVALAGCAAAVSRPDPNDARWASERWPGTSVADLSRGQDLFLSRCSSCHALPQPDGKTPDEWASVLGEMGAKAKLSSGDQELVLRYLSAASERAHASQGEHASASPHHG